MHWSVFTHLEVGYVDILRVLCNPRVTHQKLPHLLFSPINLKVCCVNWPTCSHGCSKENGTKSMSWYCDCWLATGTLEQRGFTYLNLTGIMQTQAYISVCKTLHFQVFKYCKLNKLLHCKNIIYLWWQQPSGKTAVRNRCGPFTELLQCLLITVISDTCLSCLQIVPSKLLLWP